MRCENCDYPLWNLRARQCPECGTPFRPSERQFIRNSVQFCCPHCDQPYYGTTLKGHLDPVEFDCVKCGRHIHMDEMVLRPAEGVGEQQTRIDRMPWLERRQRGVIKAWFAMIGRAMTAPTSLMRAIPKDTSLGAAWSFMFFTNLIFRIPAAVIPSLFMLIAWGTASGMRPPGAGGVFGAATLTQIAVQLAIFLVIAALAPIAWIMAAYGLLRLGGRVEGGLARTWHAICYSAGANVFSAIPCGCVSLGGLVWWTISALLMVKAGNRVGAGRAIFAVIGSAALISILAFSAVAVVWFQAVGMPTGSAMLRMETSTVSTALLAYARSHGDQWPPHAASLLVSGDLSAWDYVTMNTLTTIDEVPIGDTTLDQVAFIKPAELESLIAREVGRLPDSIVAHRLGDFVFTHHGLDLATAPPELWIVLHSPDPDVNPSARGGRCHAATVGGSVRVIRPQQRTAAIAAQNALRQSVGLAPLPDPATVTHDQPGTAEP